MDFTYQQFGVYPTLLERDYNIPPSGISTRSRTHCQPTTEAPRMNNPTLAYQQAFAAHLRNPQQYATPTAVDPQRMQIYVDLLFNNLQDFLSTTFPVTYSILSNNEWLSLVRAFYAEHACQTPYFREIAGECVQWLSQRQPSLALCQKYPFLIELMHYEWVEIALLSDPSAIDDNLIQAPADLLNNPLVLNPVLLLQAYQYPVQRISPQQLRCRTHVFSFSTQSTTQNRLY